jgi:hypothetical protein
MARFAIIGFLALGLMVGCRSTGAEESRLEGAGSGEIVAGDHDVLAFIAVGGVT